MPEFACLLISVCKIMQKVRHEFGPNFKEMSTTTQGTGDLGGDQDHGLMIGCFKSIFYQCIHKEYWRNSALAEIYPL